MFQNIVIAILFIMFTVSLLSCLFIIIELRKQEKAEAEENLKRQEAENARQQAAADALNNILKDNENAVNKMYSGANNGGFDASIDLLRKLSEEGKDRTNTAKN